MNKKMSIGVGIGAIIIVTVLASGCMGGSKDNVSNKAIQSTPEISKTEVVVENNSPIEGDQSAIAARETDWNIKEGGKRTSITHKDCGFGLSIPEKWKIDQKDNLYLAKEKGYAIISNELKAAPYLSFTIICGNSIVIDTTQSAYEILREESRETIVGRRNLSGDNTTKIQYINFERNGKKYSIEIRVNYSTGTLLGNFLNEKEYKAYYKEEQQAIDSILKTFYFLDEK